LAHANVANGSYPISGNTPGFIKHATDQGALDPNTVISVTAWLKLHNTAQLDQLVQSQNQKANANYHKWLSQSQFNATYGPTSQEVKSVTNFLTAHKLTVLTTAEDNSYVKVQGTVGDIEKAFHTQIDTYSFDGQTYYANTADPNINDASGAHIDAITGLDNYGFTPDIAFQTMPDGQPVKPVPLSANPQGLIFAAQCFTAPESHTFTGTGVTATYSGNRYGADISNTAPGTVAPCGYQPSELQTAYSMTPLYQAGLDGTGQTVVIIDAFGSPTIRQDAAVFSSVMGLPDLNSSNFQVYQAPGSSGAKPCNANKRFCAGTWADEITMDVEWVHAMAPGAHIALVISPNNVVLDEAINWAVVHHLGNTISNSWGGPEGFGNLARYNRDNRILEEAVVQGIDVNAASGDYGDYSTVLPFKSVPFPSSSPFATSVGGTSLALNPDHTIAWQAGWGNNGTLITYNAAHGNAPVDPPDNSPTEGLGFSLGSGGGPSRLFPKPSWQSSLPGTMRQTPDVGLLADTFTGVEIIETIDGQLFLGVAGGTSLACPMFSAIMAIAAQKAGHPLGQAAPLLYGLTSSNGTGTPIYDVQPVGSATNVTGSITDSGGTTSYSADQLAAPLYGTTTYYSAYFNSPYEGFCLVLTFGTDTSLMTAVGWDNVTGVGTPNGANFVNALS
jgi:subtilase family serine protease